MPPTVGSNSFRDRLGYWMERVAGGEERSSSPGTDGRG
jgi:hypothetical protein